MIKIFVGSYKGYNEGILDGSWHELPTPTIWEDIEASCVDGAEEFGIFDYECEFMNIRELDDIEELNELAEQLERLDEYDNGVIMALLGDGYDIGEAMELLNYCVYWQNMDMVDIAEHYINECYNIDNMGTLANYIDYEAFARDLEIEGNFIECDNGIVEVFR